MIRNFIVLCIIAVLLGFDYSSENWSDKCDEDFNDGWNSATFSFFRPKLTEEYITDAVDYHSPFELAYESVMKGRRSTCFKNQIFLQNFFEHIEEGDIIFEYKTTSIHTTNVVKIISLNRGRRYRMTDGGSGPNFKSYEFDEEFGNEYLNIIKDVIDSSIFKLEDITEEQFEKDYYDFKYVTVVDSCSFNFMLVKLDKDQFDEILNW